MNQEVVPLFLISGLRCQFLRGNEKPCLLLALFLKNTSEVCLMCGFYAGERKNKKRNLYDVPKRQDLTILPSYCLALGSFPVKTLIVLVSI